MYFHLIRRRELGAAIPADQLRKISPLKVDVQIFEHHSQSLGRVTTQAQVLNRSPGPDIIPPLLDAKVTGMATLGMNITGVEEVDGVLYAQSWWCRAVE
ncbi:hypothetical protein [Pseudomonas mosselii]|uniref:hypothetical protein n=1 Tax=Pseudomonas mosselii TaxID=78327 RepID=UPI002022D2FF|nr:hypothetical protein [Pseudomonas mosselii]MCL8301409.1 hypothetical protein [Pseudomonas mosselii]MCL8341068.1 hypothetical protein [Pseudomonas mosselii]